MPGEPWDTGRERREAVPFRDDILRLMRPRPPPLGHTHPPSLHPGGRMMRTSRWRRSVMTPRLPTMGLSWMMLLLQSVLWRRGRGLERLSSCAPAAPKSATTTLSSPKVSVLFQTACRRRYGLPWLVLGAGSQAPLLAGKRALRGDRVGSGLYPVWLLGATLWFFTEE